MLFTCFAGINLSCFFDLVPFFPQGRLLQRPFHVSKNRLNSKCSRYYKSEQFYHKYGRLLLSQIGATVIINRGSSYNYKSGQNYYKSEQLQTITIWERFIRNQGSYCKSRKLLKIGAQLYYMK